MSEHDDAEKTEEATPERKRKAREDGQFPRAKDAGSIAASAAVVLLVSGFGKELFGTVGEVARRCFSQSADLSRGDILAAIGPVLLATLSVVVPLAVVSALAAVAIGILEAGLEPRFELAMPKWSRIDPLPKLGQLFSPKDAAVNGVLALLRVGVVGLVTYQVLTDEYPQLVRLARTDVATGASELLRVGMRIAIYATVSLVVLAALDYGNSWFKHQRQIRMSRQEIKEEMIQQEGDPRVRAKQRARRRELGKRNLAKQVGEASVVIVNPTHVSVALRYKQDEGAPMVAAKGYDEVALQIRKIALERGIPIIENKPLARTLAANVRVGRRIPVELYAAVAEVLAVVYRLRQRAARR